MVDHETEAREHVARLVADLGRHEAYPYPLDNVALEETHISLAFLAGDYVYKVKKPVDFGFLDFSMLERRRFFCEEEVRLNRRLTRDVYLGVERVVEVGGRLQLFGDGPAVEYAVKMRRLSDQQTLRFLVDNELVTEEMLAAIADRLVAFYREAATGPGVDEWGTVDAVWHNIDENVQQTQPYLNRIIAPTQLQLIEEASRSFLDRHAEKFASRIAAGKIREGHGDLHLAHIYVEGLAPDQLQILDCVEFNPRLRCGDIAVDIAFLAMDLDYCDRPELARQVVDLLAERLDDPDLPLLVQFFSIYRAHVRNKVACFRLDELVPELPEYFVVRNEANRYIDLATSYIVEPERPTLYVVGGFSGTGKSVISRRLARSIGAGLVSSDVVRLELAGRAAGDRRPTGFGTGIYTQEFNEQTYETLFERARAELESGRSVVVEATFLDPTRRESARDLAAQTSADLLFFECFCPPEVIRERLANRAKEFFEPSEADWAIYQKQRELYGDSLTVVPDLPRVRVDTNRSSAEVLETVLSSLRLRRRL